MDRISRLPDELLVNILLLVPTQVAVSTSLLSKRWEFLWMWLPKLKYGASNYSVSEWESLEYFLQKNMPLHRATVIESFSLDLCGSSQIKSENIKLWVKLAVSRCVRELEIMYESYPDKPNILPSNLYTSESLGILKLGGNILVDVPRMVFLPSLKTLKLHSVKYVSGESLHQLLSKCPILEDLSVEVRNQETTEKLTVVVPSLLRLSLFIPRSYDLDGIVICTPNLEYLQLKDYSGRNHYYLVDNMPNLTEAYLDVHSPNIVDVHSPNIDSLIGSITAVERLTICSEHMYGEGIVFNKLEHLEVCRCKENSSGLLVRLLKDSPNVQDLNLSVIKKHYPLGVVYWNEPSTVPACMLSNLQTLNWLLLGEPGEKDILVYILQNAVHLKTARITEHDISKTISLLLSCIRKDLVLSRMRKKLVLSRIRKELVLSRNRKELVLSLRASATCQLIFG